MLDNAPKPPAIADVALLIDTSSEWARKIIAGVIAYKRQHGAWHLFVEPRSANEHMALPRGWKGQGVIATIHDKDLALRLRRSGLPVVNVSSVLRTPAFPQVSSDKAAACRMAARFYFERGYTQFGYISIAGNGWDRATRDVFMHEVESAGGHCAVYEVKSHAWGAPDWNLSIRKLGQWIQSLPKPTGIFSWAVGRELVHSCRYFGIKIPEEIALLMYGYDEVFSEASHVPISGLVHNLEGIGYEAARLLDAMMQGQSVAPEQHFIPPLSVKTAQSTDATAIQDEATLKALSYIRETVGAPVQVDDVVKHAGISRRVLERRFLSILGRTPAEHIRHVHLERAKQLLRETNLAITDVSDAAGFGSTEYMTFLFSKHLGMSPLKYRRHAQHGS